jgi:hypothetical protein
MNSKEAIEGINALETAKCVIRQLELEPELYTDKRIRSLLRVTTTNLSKIICDYLTPRSK